MFKLVAAGVFAATLAVGTAAVVTKSSTPKTATVTTTTTAVGPVAKAPVTVNESTTSLVTETVTISPSQIVYFDTPFVPETVDAAIAMINQNSNSTIYLVINSPGGSVLDGARLINVIQNSPKNIITVCDNICASMGFQVFEVGKKRLMVEHALLMAHPASGGAQGTLENMSAVISAFKKFVDRLDEAVAKRAGIDYNTFKHMVADNIWAETPEAISLGLADGVVYLDVKNTFNEQVTNSVFQYLTKKNQWRNEFGTSKGYNFTVGK